jgi:hypothetical protein
MMSTKAKSVSKKAAKKISTAMTANKKKTVASVKSSLLSKAKPVIKKKAQVAKEKPQRAKALSTPKKPKKDEKLTGYPLYPANEDIYSRTKEEADLDPENPQKKKAPNAPAAEWNEKDFNDDMTAEDLDIPGNEADEEEENAGKEDEENNYYSLGDELK